MKLHAERLGDGPPLIVLHGLLGSGDNWLGLAKNWAQAHTVILPDLRNHGRSPHAEATSVDLMAADIGELLTDHGFSQATVLGHSLGGKVAMRLAMDSPKQVSGLIVVDIAPRPYPPAHEGIVRALLGIDLAKHSTRSTVDVELSRAIPEAPVRQWLLKNLARDAHGSFYWRPNLPAILKDLPDLSNGFIESGGYDGPALFIRGGRSRYVTEEDVSSIRQRFSKAEVHTIPEAGHWVHVDAPGIIGQLVDDFAARC
jgi:pimeloyl-ACP methyl ester carboxylesterase